MTDLRTAAQQVVNEHEAGFVGLSLDKAVAVLRAALAEPPHPPFIAATAIEQQAYAFGWWHGLDKGREMREALQIIATPQRPDGTWNRDREACRQLAAEVLGFHNKAGQDE